MSFNKECKGYWLLVLHAHLPFVKHPEYNDSIEERWFFEALLETYIPLLDVFEKLSFENIDFKLCMSISPTLMAMFDDDFLRVRFLKYLENLIELTEKEITRTKGDEVFNHLAKMYNERFNQVYNSYTEKYKCDINYAFKKFQELGYLEIITSSATHCYLPLYEAFPSGVRAQIEMGLKEYQNFFGKSSSGMWNAECGYFEGLEKYFEKYGIKYFFTDTHTVLNSSVRPEYGIFAPLETPEGIVYFGRDVETSRLVWSAREGYPGDPYYREFYRDIGFDLDYDYIKPYIHEGGNRVFTCVKYYRVTDKELPLEYKKPYIPAKAMEKVKEHSQHFVSSREKQINYVASLMDRKPVVVSMYDAELFGHWWYEGIDFLYNVFKGISNSSVVKMITPSEYLKLYPVNQISTPQLSSWGSNGYSEFWLNETNDWIYRHIHKCIDKMCFLAKKFERTSSTFIKRVLNQAAREVLLAMASDWPFIMKTKTMEEYAKRRVLESIDNFNNLYEMCQSNRINENILLELEKSHSIFLDIDYRIFI